MASDCSEPVDLPDPAELVEAVPARLWAAPDAAGGGTAISAGWTRLTGREPAHDGQEIRAEIGHEGAAGAAGQPNGLGFQLVQGLCRQVGARRRLEDGRVHRVSQPLERG